MKGYLKSCAGALIYKSIVRFTSGRYREIYGRTLILVHRDFSLSTAGSPTRTMQTTGCSGHRYRRTIRL